MAKSDLDNPSSSRSLARPAGGPYKPSSITQRDYGPEPPLALFALKPMALGDGPHAVLAIGLASGLPAIAPIWAIARVTLSNPPRLWSA